jgi:hypothetical protein
MVRKVKVKFTPEQATKPRGVADVKLYSSFDLAARWQWVLNITPQPLYPREDPVTIVQQAGWAPGSVWTGAENLSPTGIRSPDRPARSESLYRLKYHGPFYILWYSGLTNQHRSIDLDHPNYKYSIIGQKHFSYNDHRPAWLPATTGCYKWAPTAVSVRECLGVRNKTPT